ncbi:MAG: inorganic phosphate transporter [Alistipes sp.]|jgi:phosphate/sulfate permease|nr:inorganic phosphate transporter [Alistipes sp.]
MDIIYTVVLVILAVTAVSGLFVGVTNDAVNFLNSAIGSKAAPMRIILLVASIGIVVGTLTASGMMEVARTGMFNPELFTFKEVMMLYLAVMLGNIVLLDVYNTLGLPTSTTVSLIFALLGAAIAVTMVKIGRDPQVALDSIGQYINTARAMGIVSGILISVVVALVGGTMVMYLSRILFSFRYAKIFRWFGAAWCGVAVTTILYYVIIKGLKAPLAGTEFLEFVNANTALTVAGMWAASSLVLLGLQLLKINILKVTILVGTFSLALAFAGNDLVNFIGVPIAGLDSWRMASESGDVNMMMGGLRESVPANFLLLLGAGLIMIVTLWFSKKAMNVTETEIKLASAKEGEEKYGSTMFSRSIVRAAVGMNNGYKYLLPERARLWVDRRFEQLNAAERGTEHYDLIRATVNLITSSLLIAFGTSLGLPLSTTYVTFMVAMGSSLADRAWGRETAVYRISGVVTVVMGWFVTGLGAFVISMAIGLGLMYGGTVAIIVISALALFLLVRSNLRAKKKDLDATAADGGWLDTSKDSREILEQCRVEVRDVMDRVTNIYNRTMVAVMKENRKALRDLVRDSNELFYSSRDRKYAMMPVLQKLHGSDIETVHYYVQVVDYLSEVTKALVHITRPCFDHIDNNHKGFHKDQVHDLVEVNNDVKKVYDKINTMLSTNDFSDMEHVMHMRDKLLELIGDAVMRQLRRIRGSEHGTTKTSVLYLNILNETKTMVLQSRNLLKSQKYFVTSGGLAEE